MADESRQSSMFAPMTLAVGVIGDNREGQRCPPPAYHVRRLTPWTLGAILVVRKVNERPPLLFRSTAGSWPWSPPAQERNSRPHFGDEADGEGIEMKPVRVVSLGRARVDPDNDSALSRSSKPTAQITRRRARKITRARGFLDPAAPVDPRNEVIAGSSGELLFGERQRHRAVG